MVSCAGVFTCYISGEYRILLVNFSLIAIYSTLSLKSIQQNKTHLKMTTNGHANGHSQKNVVLITGAGGWLGGVVSS